MSTLIKQTKSVYDSSEIASYSKRRNTALKIVFVLDVEILTFNLGIFFKGRTGEDYAEVFLNIDSMDNWLELREMGDGIGLLIVFQIHLF